MDMTSYLIHLLREMMDFRVAADGFGLSSNPSAAGENGSAHWRARSPFFVVSFYFLNLSTNQAGPLVFVLTLPELLPGPAVVLPESLFAPGSETVSALLEPLDELEPDELLPLFFELELAVVSVWALVTPGRSYSTSAVVVSTAPGSFAPVVSLVSFVLEVSLIPDVSSFDLVVSSEEVVSFVFFEPAFTLLPSESVS